ncbi:Outer membrane protein TolC [Paenimyroides ummariense]|uniref:Outer membrane protein TolC n=1 Tax=Paenimyroides ummariense TaxID=913024 RepID=A0A1I5FVZ7_9FLAO|nr:TolC family protein [Paenimyroides ummariense]SFO27978.1 Outer membrane protein TolC [Paenimyroides ummariense]
MNKLLNFFLLLMLMLFSYEGKAQQLSLIQCLEYGKENQPDFKMQQLKINQKKETKRSFGSQFLPEIGMSASHAYSFGSSINPSNNNREPSNIQSDNFSVDARINVFDYSKWNQSKIQQLDVEIEKLQFQVIENTFELLVLEKFMKALSLQQWKKSTLYQIGNSKEQLQRISKEVEQGKRAKSDLYDIQVIFLQDEQTLSKITEDEILAKLELIQLLNHPSVTVNIELQMPEKVDLRETDFNIDQNISLLKHEIILEKSKEEVKQLKNLFMPTLQFNYSYGTFFAQKINNFSDTNLQFGSQLKDNKNQYVGLSLYIPIFQKGNALQKQNLKRLEQQVLIAEQEKEQKRLNDLKDVLIQKVNSLQLLENNLNDLVTASKKAFETTAQKYLFDKVDASVYKMAKNQLLQAEYDLLANRLDQLYFKQQLEINF